MLKIDLDYIEKNKMNINSLFPEIYEFIYPFEERGSFKKEYRVKYTYPTDSEYSTNEEWD